MWAHFIGTRGRVKVKVVEYFNDSDEMEKMSAGECSDTLWGHSDIGDNVVTAATGTDDTSTLF